MTTPDDDALHVEVRLPGPSGGGGVPLVLLHGFTQTGRLWGPFGEGLAVGHRLVLVDLPGHGGSARVQADLPGSAERVLAAVPPVELEPAGDREDAGRFDLLGYSLGARVALHLALAHPERVRRLVLLGATGGIDDDARRAARRRADEALADDLEASGDVPGFVDRWLAQPMFANLPDTASWRAERLRNTPRGLATSLRLAGTGTQEPLWGRLPSLDLPVLVMAGADDPRFVVAGQRLAAGLPDAVLALVPGAGHAAHLHRPAVATRMVHRWLVADASR